MLTRLSLILMRRRLWASDGWYDLTVHATTRSGIQLAPYDCFFTVS